MSAQRKIRRKFLRSLKTKDAVIFAWQAGRITTEERDKVLANRFKVRVIMQQKPSAKVNLDEIDKDRIRKALDKAVNKDDDNS